MQKNKIFKKYASLLVALVYSFVVLFSMQFHQHSHEFSVENTFAKSEKNTSAITIGQDSHDCLACHFFSKNQGFVPIDFSVSFFSTEIFSSQNTDLDFAVGETLILFFNLRAPPVFLV
ncbi:MAG: hypothetical protein Q4G16_03995 [Cruoricaptor ignavus]|nr:hypothetical protein [Cruoricaptor ignavus]